MLMILDDFSSSTFIMSLLYLIANSLINLFNIKTPIIGNIEIGNSQIKINIPFTDKRLVFNSQDLQILKQTLIGENCTNLNE